jgi:ArsR family transcriptional regulator, cadmium/lead-responsive transcriptional repressor
MNEDADRSTVGEASETGALAVAACLFHGFSDPSRLSILRHLALGEHRVVELTAHLGLAQSTVSKHLACLRDCGLVSARPEGRATVYSLNHGDALMDLWAAAERLLELTGGAVALCPRYGTTTIEDGGERVEVDHDDD